MFFFFSSRRRHTRSLCDWSSDVCSSDLEFVGFTASYAIAALAATGLITWYCSYFLGGGARTLMIGGGLIGVYTFLYITLRSEERRVGKECRSRRLSEPEKRKKRIRIRCR